MVCMARYVKSYSEDCDADDGQASKGKETSRKDSEVSVVRVLKFHFINWI